MLARADAYQVLAAEASGHLCILCLLCMCRPLGLGRHWKRMYCALVACRHKPGAAATELQMLLLHEANLCSVERLSVTPCTVASQTKAASAASADKMHISLVRKQQDGASVLQRACSDAPARKADLRCWPQFAMITTVLSHHTCQ